MRIEGFEWDDGNKTKNWVKHQVSAKETEEVFLNKSQVLYKDIEHSQKEDRYVMLGTTNQRRLLYVTFTVRKDKIRVISARDQSRKERNLYEKETA